MKKATQIALLTLLLAAMVICVFLTSRDFYYSLLTFFGVHQGEDVSRLYLASYGFEIAVIIYTISSGRSTPDVKATATSDIGQLFDLIITDLYHNRRDYIIVLSSVIVNSTYLCYMAGEKGGGIAHYATGITIGITFPVIVVWLAVKFRDILWDFISEYGLDERLKALVKELQERLDAAQSDASGLREENEGLRAFAGDLQAKLSVSRQADNDLQASQAKLQAAVLQADMIAAELQAAKKIIEELTAAKSAAERTAKANEIVAAGLKSELDGMKSRKLSVAIDAGTIAPLSTLVRSWYDLDRQGKAGDTDKAEKALSKIDEVKNHVFSLIQWA